MNYRRYNNRRSTRLKGYDYSSPGFYFITIICLNRAHLFGRIEGGQMSLNAFGEIIEEEWRKTPRLRQNVALHDYVIMPNHFHTILQILFPKNSKDPEESSAQPAFKSPSHTVGAVVRGFKGITTKKVKELTRLTESNGEDNGLDTGRGEWQFAPTRVHLPIEKIDVNQSIWQRNYYDIIIRNEKSYHRISRYIKNNPKNWKEDELY